MSPSPDGNLSHAERVSLKEHLLRLLQEQDVRLQNRMTAMEVATERARITMDQRLNVMNEMREQLNEWRSATMTRIEMNAKLERIEVELVQLRQAKDRAEGYATQKSVTVATLLSVASLAIALVGLILMIARFKP